MEDIESYLVSKGLTVKPAGASNFHISCPFCGEDAGKRGRLYVAKDSDPPGLFMCHLCGKKGAYNSFRKFFGDPILKSDDTGEGNEDSYRKHDVLQEAASYYHDLLADNEDAYRYLRDKRGLSLETIQTHQLGWSDGTLTAHLRKKEFSLKDLQATGLVDTNGRDFFQRCITIPYHVQGSVVQIRGKQIGAKYLTPPGNKARLFNTDVTFTTTDQVLVTEGEFDALIMEELGYPAVGVPGATSWQESWGGYFEAIRKIYVVFDNDAAGTAGAAKVAAAIGPKARIVEMPEAGAGEAKNDPSEWVVGKGHSRDDFEMLLFKAKGGILVTVDDSYAEWLEIQEIPGLKLGIEPIDAKLLPGLLPSQLMLVLAKTGVGKTLFTLNIFHRMLHENPEARILFVSLEQTRSEWFERARRIWRFYNLAASDRDCLDFYRDRLMIVDKNRLGEDELISCIEQYEFDMGQKPDLVAVDYLGYWARSYKGEAYERTSAAVMALKAIAKQERIAIFAPHQVSRVVKFGESMEADAARDAGVVEETADFILALWAEDMRANRQEREKNGAVSCKVLKSRHGGSGTICSLQFAPLSLAMIPMSDPLVQRAKDEHQMASRSDSFEIAIHRHRTGCHSLMCNGDCDLEAIRD